MRIIFRTFCKNGLVILQLGVYLSHNDIHKNWHLILFFYLELSQSVNFISMLKKRWLFYGFNYLKKDSFWTLKCSIYIVN